MFKLFGKKSNGDYSKRKLHFEMFLINEGFSLQSTDNGVISYVKSILDDDTIVNAINAIRCDFHESGYVVFVICTSGINYVDDEDVYMLNTEIVFVYSGKLLDVDTMKSIYRGSFGDILSGKEKSTKDILARYGNGVETEHMGILDIMNISDYIDLLENASYAKNDDTKRNNIIPFPIQ